MSSKNEYGDYLQLPPIKKGKTNKVLFSIIGDIFFKDTIIQLTITFYIQDANHRRTIIKTIYRNGKNYKHHIKYLRL